MNMNNGNVPTVPFNRRNVMVQPGVDNSVNVVTFTPRLVHGVQARFSASSILRRPIDGITHVDCITIPSASSTGRGLPLVTLKSGDMENTVCSDRLKPCVALWMGNRVSYLTMRQSFEIIPYAVADKVVMLRLRILKLSRAIFKFARMVLGRRPDGVTNTADDDEAEQDGRGV